MRGWHTAIRSCSDHRGKGKTTYRVLQIHTSSIATAILGLSVLFSCRAGYSSEREKHGKTPRTGFHWARQNYGAGLACSARGLTEIVHHQATQEIESGGAGVVFRQLVADFGETIIKNGMKVNGGRLYCRQWRAGNLSTTATPIPEHTRRQQCRRRRGQRGR